MMEFKVEDKIKHYKGGIYTFLGIGTESETGDEVGIYRNDKDNRIWVRPIDMFYEEVKYKGDWVQRFEIHKTRSVFVMCENCDFEMSAEGINHLQHELTDIEGALVSDGGGGYYSICPKCQKDSLVFED